MEDLIGGPLFHHLAAVHDHDPIGDFGNDTHVVGDENHRHAKLVLQEPDQSQDLRLNGDVERGRGLVGDEQTRLAGKCHRDHDPLSHAARQLMRVAVQDLRRLGNSHLL